MMTSWDRFSSPPPSRTDNAILPQGSAESYKKGGSLSGARGPSWGLPQTLHSGIFEGLGLASLEQCPFYTPTRAWRPYTIRAGLTNRPWPPSIHPAAEKGSSRKPIYRILEAYPIGPGQSAFSRSIPVLLTRHLVARLDSYSPWRGSDHTPPRPTIRPSARPRSPPTLNANPSSGDGNAEPGQTGNRARTLAEANHEDFGHAQADQGQSKDDPCDDKASSGPPKAFNPK
jgi:hypothetical protein